MTTPRVRPAPAPAMDEQFEGGITNTAQHVTTQGTVSAATPPPHALPPRPGPSTAQALRVPPATSSGIPPPLT